MKSKRLNREQISHLYDSMKELYIIYREKCDHCSEKNVSLSFRLEELSQYVTYLEKEKNKDSFVFSPRGILSKNAYMKETGKGYVIDDIHVEQKQEELKQLREQASKLEDELRTYQSLVDVLEKNMNLLYDLKQTSSKSDNKEQNELYFAVLSGNRLVIKYLKNDIKDSLSYISHLTKMISSYVDSDPMRAKLELSKLEKSIDDIICEMDMIEFLLQPYPYEVTIKKELDDLVHNILLIYPKAEVKIRIDEGVYFESYIVRIMIYLLIKDILFFLLKENVESKFSISFYKTKDSYEFSISSIGKELYNLLINNDSKSDVLNKILILDDDYEIFWNEDMNKSKLVINPDKMY